VEAGLGVCSRKLADREGYVEVEGVAPISGYLDLFGTGSDLLQRFGELHRNLRLAGA
jgi:hypothetical protein